MRRSQLLVCLACVLVVLLVACMSDTQQKDGSETSMANNQSMKPGPIVYVALGDSTGSGVGATGGGYVARLFQRILEPRPGSKLTNLCISGDHG